MVQWVARCEAVLWGAQWADIWEDLWAAVPWAQDPMVLEAARRAVLALVDLLEDIQWEGSVWEALEALLADRGSTVLLRGRLADPGNMGPVVQADQVSMALQGVRADQVLVLHHPATGRTEAEMVLPRGMGQMV